MPECDSRSVARASVTTPIGDSTSASEPDSEKRSRTVSRSRSPVSRSRSHSREKRSRTVSRSHSVSRSRTISRGCNTESRAQKRTRVSIANTLKGKVDSDALKTDTLSELQVLWEAKDEGDYSYDDYEDANLCIKTLIDKLLGGHYYGAAPNVKVVPWYRRRHCSPSF